MPESTGFYMSEENNIRKPVASFWITCPRCIIHYGDPSPVDTCIGCGRELKNIHMSQTLKLAKSGHQLEFDPILESK